MVNYILSDLDGVVRIWNNDDLFELEKSSGLQEKTFFSICFERKLLEQAITGKITDDAWREEVKSRFEKQYPHLPSQQFLQLWENACFEVNEAVVQAYQTYFPDAKLLMATNGTTKLDSDLEKMDIKDLFSRIYNSADLGYAKPDPAYYEYIWSDIVVAPEEIIYVDDSPQLVEVGTQMGMICHHYSSVEGLTEFLIASTQRNEKDFRRYTHRS